MFSAAERMWPLPALQGLLIRTQSVSRTPSATQELPALQG
ncbi:hypothetical protein CFP59_07174 [Streptomyces malaysiensis subsp. malaysiensis]|nr:hypothetical protein CFP59_07174 [Streptomyces sp. M56]